MKPRDQLLLSAEYYYRKHPRFWKFILVLAILLLVLLIYKYFTSGRKKPAPPPVPVVVAPAQKSDVPVYLSGLGAVTPKYNVTIKTRVDGQLIRVLYKEGQLVRAGELLAEIDPRPFQAQLVQFEGALMRDQALLANAQVDLKRYQGLVSQGAVSRQIYATQQSLVKQLQGTVKFDEGQILTVKVNLLYTRIISPINGRVGLRLVDPGNIVQTTDTTGLVILNTVTPINVIFTLPEDDLPQVIEQSKTGKPLIAKAYDREQNRLLATGTLLTTDNQIDTTTGTFRLKAEFANKDLVLFPNQFVNIALLVNVLHNATVVPSRAVQHNMQETFVYILNRNNTVSVRPVKTSVTYGNNTTITSGIAPGDRVVVEGVDKLTDGAKVTVAQQSTLYSKTWRKPIYAAWLNKK